MSILLLGDIHGDFAMLTLALTIAREQNIKTVIQLGDWGQIYPSDDTYLLRCVKGFDDIEVLFIDGNHDNCDYWNLFTPSVMPQAVPGKTPNIKFVPRGSILHIDGRTIAFMGGAGSIDKEFRQMYNKFWTAGENITSSQINDLYRNLSHINKVDMFLTHCPPDSVIRNHFPDEDKLGFGVGLDWTDPNQEIIQRLWSYMEFPPIYSGHMHKSVLGKNYRILNINETLVV